jgi:hypothetical protein
MVTPSPRALARALLLASFGMGFLSGSLIAQQVDSALVEGGDSVRVRLIDVELRTAVQALSQYLDQPIVIGTIGNARVSLETPMLSWRASGTARL